MPSASKRSKRKRHKTLFERQGGRCYWCGCEMVLARGKRGQPFRNTCTVDHVYTRGDPRRTDPAVLEKGNTTVGACYDCNNRRGNTPFEDFKKLMEERANGPV